MASEAVLKYLVDTNRPYSCADVTVNLRGAYTKGAVQKALDALAESGKIKCKLYGKQKVFAAIQLDTVEDDNDAVDYDTLTKDVTIRLEDKTNVLKVAESKLKVLTSAPTNETAKLQMEETRKRLEAYEMKLKVLSESKEVVSAEEKTIILTEHDKFLKEYKKRKRMCTDMMDAILEGYPKSKKTFLEELCIETDEIAGFSLSTYS